MEYKNLFAATLLLGSVVANASPTLHIDQHDNTYTLMGISGFTTEWLESEGRSADWMDEGDTVDVKFKTGTFEEAHGLSREEFVAEYHATYPFQGMPELTHFLYAFLDSDIGKEYTTNDNYYINGCSSTCEINTPYKWDIDDVDSHIYDVEYEEMIRIYKASYDEEYGYIPPKVDGTFPDNTVWDPKTNGYSTWAVWSFNDVPTAVTEPSSLLLLLSAILPVWLRRNRGKKL